MSNFIKKCNKCGSCNISISKNYELDDYGDGIYENGILLICNNCKSKDKIYIK